MKKKDAINIGKRVKEIREKRGINQEDLAIRVGISRAYIHKIEAGHSIPTIVVMVKIAKVLNESIDYLAQDIKSYEEEVREEIESMLENKERILNIGLDPSKINLDMMNFEALIGLRDLIVHSS